MDKSWKKILGIRAKTTDSYLKDNDEDEKPKGTKTCIIKRKLKFEDYKNCLEAAQIENKINNLEKYKIDVDSSKEFIKNDNNEDLKIKGTTFLLIKLTRLL